MARRFSVDGKLGHVLVKGTKLSADVAEAVTSATVSLSSSEVTQLTLTIVDPRFTVLERGLFSAGTPSKQGSRCDYGGLALEVRAIEVGPRGEDHALTITARSLAAGKARRQKGAHVKRDLSPTDYVRASAKRLGLRFVGQPSAKRKNIGRQKNENEWETWQRLATELGYVCFEAAQTVYFAKPTWLIDPAHERTRILRVAWQGARTDDAIDELPTCRRTGDDAKRLATVLAKLRGDLGAQAIPGMRLVLDGVPTFAGAYMVDTVTHDLAEETVTTVDASTAINPKPQPPPKKRRQPGGSDAGGQDPDGAPAAPTGATGARSAAAFVGVALAQLGDRYVYGAEAPVSNPNPTAFDCSELVEWAAGRVGVTFGGTSGSMAAAMIPTSLEDAIATRGALLWHEGHIAISLGNGKTVEAANPSVGVVSYGAAGRFARGGRIPGMRY